MADVVQRFIQAAETGVSNSVESKQGDLDLLVKEKAKLIEDAKKLSVGQLKELRDRIYEERVEALYEEETMKENDANDLELQAIEAEINTMINEKASAPSDVPPPADQADPNIFAENAGVVDDLAVEGEQGQIAQMWETVKDAGAATVVQMIIMFKEFMLKISPPADQTVAKAQLETIKSLYATYLAPSEMAKIANGVFANPNVNSDVRMEKGTNDAVAYGQLLSKQQNEINREMSTRNPGWQQLPPEQIAALRAPLEKSMTPEWMIAKLATDYAKKCGANATGKKRVTTLDAIVNGIKKPRVIDTLPESQTKTAQ